MLACKYAPEKGHSYRMYTLSSHSLPLSFSISLDKSWICLHAPNLHTLTIAVRAVTEVLTSEVSRTVRIRYVDLPLFVDLSKIGLMLPCWDWL
ncbi:hypothetical protein DUNSADRAFT_18578 [Dunaliella salina]|uniref:Uncharacterized protein n=1 Tax=Dunaliella salina TaxID=3046 RepID=A0ABQ7GYY1_DUNSA|nr:hypothetical protein DUNSADRAFT_18578 [Dunaliella salina]|eukprot:KAF5839815.1 hypothetical protein DUNSADRAFT_18578 [Dunaliella salina]